MKQVQSALNGCTPAISCVPVHLGCVMHTGIHAAIEINTFKSIQLHKIQHMIDGLFRPPRTGPQPLLNIYTVQIAIFLARVM